MLQLNPPLPFNTPKGEGFAHFLVDYGPESDLYWIVLITATGEIWTYANKDVRASKNITLGRIHPTSPRPSAKPRLEAPADDAPSGPVVGPVPGLTCGQDCDAGRISPEGRIAMDAHVLASERMTQQR